MKGQSEKAEGRDTVTQRSQPTCRDALELGGLSELPKLRLGLWAFTLPQPTGHWILAFPGGAGV